jgi:hypothetical protein
MTPEQLEELQKVRRQLRERQWKCPNAVWNEYCFEGCKDCDEHSTLAARERELMKS